MGRKWMALALTLCLLLSGCGGGTSKPEAASSEQQTQTESEISAVVLDDEETAEPAADSQPEPELDDMTPEELGQWLWAQMEAHNAATYAVDYELNMQVKVTVGEESVRDALHTRVKKITDGDDTAVYIDASSGDSYSEAWYGGGYVYQWSNYGKFKAPITEEEMEAQDQDGAEDLLKLDADSFGTFTAEPEGNDYVLTFGDVSLDTWVAFSDMLSAGDENVNCTGFLLSGTVKMKPDGSIQKLKMDLSVQMDLYGTTISQEIQLTQETWGYDDQVSIHVPEDDASYRELSDISLPKEFENGFTLLASQYAMGFQEGRHVEIYDGRYGEYDLQETFHYILGGENGLAADCDVTETWNGETMSRFTEQYANGQGTQQSPEGEATFETDDNTYLSSLYSELLSYSDVFPYGSNYEQEEDGNYQKISFDVDSEYVENVIGYYVTALVAEELGVENADEVKSYGTMEVWFDATGMVARRVFHGAVEYHVDGTIITASVNDEGTVLAVNDAVTVGAGA